MVTKNVGGRTDILHSFYSLKRETLDVLCNSKLLHLLQLSAQGETSYDQAGLP